MDLDRFAALPRRSRSVLSTLVAQRQADAGSPGITKLGAWSHAFKTVWRERSDIAEFLRRGDEELAYDLRRRFGLGARLGTAHPIPPDLFGLSPLPRQTEPALVIIPIHNALDQTARLLRNLPRPSKDLLRIVLIDDGSTDPGIAPLLQEFVAICPEALLVSLPANAGFVAAANTGLSLRRPGEHAILLNSDALPPEQWVERLLAPFREDARIASVTPLSNAAEILSVPAPGIDNATHISKVRILDQIAQRLRFPAADLPTGIGFCMAMNRHFLDRIGGFDPAFGRGYGEEVDWCRKAIAAGGRHIAATNLFVGHDGGASFGARKKAAIASASRRIAARYPDYLQEALTWQRRDPIAAVRLALALGWLGHVATEPIPIFIGHSLGGGAEHALTSEVTTCLAGGAPAVVILRVGGPAAWRLEVQGARFSLAGDIDDFDLVDSLLEPVARREVIYSCAVHARNPAGIPEAILRLAGRQRMSMRLHDFYPISPSWNLLGSDGRFAGIPPLDTEDPAHRLARTRLRQSITHREWRAEWQRVIAAAEEIVVFARSGADLLETAYPEASGKTVIRPHRPRTLPERLATGGRSIGVLGGINLAKGGAVLDRLARQTGRRLVIIGEMDGRFQLPAPHVVHGPYQQRDIARLARHHDVGIWLIPSVCPETFSFATHEALATGLPVACFDLGAQAEAARLAPNGHLLTSDPEDGPALAAELEALFAT